MSPFVKRSIIVAVCLAAVITLIYLNRFYPPAQFQDKTTDIETKYKIISKYQLDYDSKYCRVIEFETTDGYKCVAILHRETVSITCNWNK
jgi:hypothetical protein